jgi:RNA polymerase-binding transcription factor DksA
VPTIDKDQAAARLRAREEELRERHAGLSREDGEMLDSELADYDQHPADQGTETFEQEKDASTSRMLEQQLRDVEVAKQRLDEGTYGVCIDGGEEIPAARLEAIPEALRCIEHQNRYEAQVKARGGPTLDAF